MSKFQETLLQFGLITVVGGLFTFVLSLLRDNISKNESSLSVLRDLIKQVDDLYRSTKQNKRMIRSRAKESSEGFEIKAAFFAAQMDDLSTTQLKLEQVCNIVRTRIDLFDEQRKTRILDEIGYAEKYINSVVEEFERRIVYRNDAICRITTSCKMLNDFLGVRWRPLEINKTVSQMGNAHTSTDRYKAFRSIADYEKSKWVTDKGKSITDNDETRLGCRRHRTISDKCMLLAIREMREIALERQRESTFLRMIRALRIRATGIADYWRGRLFQPKKVSWKITSPAASCPSVTEPLCGRLSTTSEDYMRERETRTATPKKEP